LLSVGPSNCQADSEPTLAQLLTSSFSDMGQPCAQV
jgi:hypothetical protein